MGNKKTPLLQMLRATGGTLYVFPSATEDIGLNLLSTTTGVAMSHFALLNIPDVSITKCLQFSGPTPSANNGNEALGMSLQNYAMNFETHLTNLEDYNYQKKETISEKVFWHWLQHIGAISFDASSMSNVSSNIYIENAYNSDSSIQDNTVVKCFGAIDAGNQLSTEFGMFNETYINIPTSWGSGPVYFKQSDDENFKLGTSYQLNDVLHLEGRTNENTYNSYTGGLDYPFYDSSSLDPNERYSYVIDSSTDGFEILKDLKQIQAASLVKFNNDKILFSSYDDVNIDVENNLSIDTEFQFNTILLYYSIYDQDDLIKTPYAINLFGVIFLDGTKPSGSNFVIPPLTKRKSSPTLFGNSYSFRVNLKTMSVYDNTDAVIQDNTTMSGISAVEFSDAISNMNRAIDIMNSNLTTTLAIQDQYASIISYYDNIESDIREISTNLYAYLRGSRSSVIDTSVLYANEIRTPKDSSLNSLLIRTSSNSADINGSMIYNEPIVTIKDTSIIIPSLENTTLWNKNSYVIVENTSTDKNIFADSTSEDSSVVRCLATLEKAFDISTGFVIKEFDASINKLYIDPESPIFTANDDKNLKYMLDKNKNIDYTAIIPYLIAEVMKLKQALKNSGTYQDLNDLSIEEMYDEIIGNNE